MRRSAVLAVVLVVAVAAFMFTRGSSGTSPQQLTLTSGASARVGGGRATLWFAQPKDEYNDQQIVTAALVSLTCQGKETSLTLLPGALSDEVCGVRVRLVQITEPGEKGRLFKGTFVVSWM